MNLLGGYLAGQVEALPEGQKLKDLKIEQLNLAAHPQIRGAGISSGLMQEKDSPRGDHIAIGPFMSRQEAEVVNTQVRAESLDSRLYFRD